MCQRSPVTNLKIHPNNASYDDYDDIMYPSAIPFVLLHLACVAVIWTGITWLAVAICVVLY
jgi:stearoyl-CoA desaturase (delta-9 desaturase)